MLESASSRRMPSLFGKDSKRSRNIKSDGNVGNGNAEPQSIVGRYRKEFGSLKAGEIKRIQDSATSCIVVARALNNRRGSITSNRKDHGYSPIQK